MVISTVLFLSRTYILPEGRRLVAVVLPLRIWRRTGTEGAENVSPFTVNAVPVYSQRCQRWGLYLEMQDAYEGDVELQVDVRVACACGTRHGRRNERVQVGLDERQGDGRRRSGFNLVSGVVSKYGAVQAAISRCVTRIGNGADPVVVGSLVGAEDEGVALASEDLNLVYDKRLHIHSVRLNDGHLVTVNRELVVWVTVYRCKL